MRYYSIKITNPSGKVMALDTSGNLVPSDTATTTFTSHDGSGNFLPNALNVELDIPALPLGASQGGLAVRIWGVGLPALAQANDLAGFGIEIKGGMRPPFQLNKNAKPGVLAVGMIFQGYGNWEGVEQHLDLVVVSQAALPDLEAAIAFSWSKNQPLDQAISAALTGAFPAFDVQGVGQVKNIIQDHDEFGFYTNLKAFAESILDVTASGTYTGINIQAVGQTFFIYDNSTATEPLKLQFQDLIGQPTWISGSTMSFASVMRADIQLGESVQMPADLAPPFVLTTPQAAVPNAPSSNQSAFKGQFSIIEVHHFGDFRQASADAWRTQYVAVSSGGQPNLLSGVPSIPAGDA
jgi:hypothetical protein